MRNIFLLSVVAVGTLFITGAIAQHEEHHGSEATPPSDKSAAMPMMSQMMPMMAAHAEATKLADQLVNGLTPIENEKNAKERDRKLAEHGQLLRQLQANLKGQSEMMEHMHGMMMGGTMPAGGKKQ